MTSHISAEIFEKIISIETIAASAIRYLYNTRLSTSIRARKLSGICVTHTPRI